MIIITNPLAPRLLKSKIRLTRKVEGALDPAVILPPPRVQSMLRSLKIPAQGVKRKSATKICLAERKPEVWGK